MCTKIHGVSGVEMYWPSRNAPFRAEVAAAIQAAFPAVRSLCDVGAHCGPQMPALRAAFPTLTLHGADPYHGAVDGPTCCAGLDVQWSTHCACQAVAEIDADLYLFSHVLRILPPAEADALVATAYGRAQRGVVILDTYRVSGAAHWAPRPAVTEQWVENSNEEAWMLACYVKPASGAVHIESVSRYARVGG